MDDRGKWFMRSRNYFSFGSSLHSVLQRFHDSNDAGVTATHEVLNALEESWISAGYGSQDEMEQALAEGKDILTSYIERHKSRAVTAKTIMVERQLRLDFGDFFIIGRIDRVDEHEDGSLEIVDYKSGRQTVDEEEVKFDLAMGVYQVLIREQFPGRPVRATIIALRSGSQASASFTEDEHEEFVSALRLLASEVMNRDYENLSPVLKDHCFRCDFSPLCRKDPEFDENYRTATL